MTEMHTKMDNTEGVDSLENNLTKDNSIKKLVTQSQLFDAFNSNYFSNNYSGVKNNFSYHNNSTDDYLSYEERMETYIVPFIFGIIFIVGFLGNGTLIHIFIRHKSMRNLPNTFIVCLAVGDLLVIVGTVPFISIIYTLESWPFGEFICKLSEFLKDVSIGVTVLTLSVLSFDRYVAIAAPFSKINDSSSKSTTLAVVVAVWCTSILFAIPGAYNSHILKYNISDNNYIKVCYPFPNELGEWYPKMIVLLRFIFFYVIPLLTIGSFYAMMARHLVQSSQQVNGLNVNHNKHIEQRTRVAKMVFTLAIIFAVCFFPNHIFMLWFYFTYPNSMDNYNTFWHLLKISGYCLTFSNSCLNPVTLYLISGKFRSHFKRYLFGCFVKRRQLERTRTFRAKPLLFYSTSVKSLSVMRQSTISTRLFVLYQNLKK
ncbi:neuropeptide CCHamide-1 receptor-like [Oppia nitens]|uniref:neuropeptide CCHamide-1 receptor-like n=1 Tax=Oppia nitens TaxID=1686743 RepID=UPI0023D99883|nr:neuropeptide CCHamide-1 receptor-like [Oppia nitens]